MIVAVLLFIIGIALNPSATLAAYGSVALLWLIIGGRR